MTMSPSHESTAENKVVDARRGVGWVGALAILLWLAAGVTLLVFGGFLSAILWAIAGLMGWSPSFDKLRAEGKQTLSKGGRVAVGTILTLLGLVMHPAWGDSSPSPPAAPAETTPVASKPTPAQVAEWTAMEARNQVKIKELLAGVKMLDQEDVEGQLYFWKDITARAPANALYRQERQRVQAEVDALTPFRQHPETAAEVVKVVGRKAAFGSVLIIDITLHNRALSHLKDFEIECEVTGNSGTTIGTARKTLYEMVEARKTRKFRNVNMGFINAQAARFGCDVVNVAIG